LHRGISRYKIAHKQREDRKGKKEILPVLMMFLRGLGVLGPLEKRRGLAITGACVHTFFDVYLKGAPADELNNLPALYPELNMGITRAFPQQSGS